MSTRRSARLAAPPFTQATAGCLSSAIGEHGLSEQELASWLNKLAEPLAELKTRYHDRTLDLLRIAEDTADLEAAEQAYAKLVAGARAIVFFGIGGSSLGGQALAQLGGWSIPGTADAAQKARPRTRFYDNLDAHTLGAALAAFDLGSARFVVTSKSGGTPETLVQA
ncbi:MAG TPA: glucose-6-phosphate isomerase, partial [Hyphomicrobiaceae bacterium]|nr:glucose-6-phosphate isomerase [Hyphomicrobiaceae bacterium]